MARPKKDIKDLKLIQVKIRMCVNDYLLVSENAKTLGLGIPDYIRRMAAKKSMPRTKVTPQNRALFVELGRIGNNLNQLTKKAHLGIHTPKLLRTEISDLKKVIDILKSNIVKNDSRTN